MSDGGESNYSDNNSMQEDVDVLSIGGYESGVQWVREFIAVNDERMTCATSDEYDSTIGSDCSCCGVAKSMSRALMKSLHHYSDAVGDLAKWSGKYMTGVATLSMCENECNNGNSVKKLVVLMKNTERRMIHERKMLYESMEYTKRLLLQTWVKEVGVKGGGLPTVCFRIVNTFDSVNVSVSVFARSVLQSVDVV
jgi:hypothetical protein